MKLRSLLACLVLMASLPCPLSSAQTTQPATRPTAVTPMTPDLVQGFDPVLPDADYFKRVEMIPMRDGVKLNTIILMKNGTKNGPILSFGSSTPAFPAYAPAMHD